MWPWTLNSPHCRMHRSTRSAPPSVHALPLEARAHETSPPPSSPARSPNETCQSEIASQTTRLHTRFSHSEARSPELYIKRPARRPCAFSFTPTTWRKTREPSSRRQVPPFGCPRASASHADFGGSQADKSLSSASSGFSFFGGREVKYQDAADLYIQAANSFKMQKQSTSHPGT